VKDEPDTGGRGALQPQGAGGQRDAAAAHQENAAVADRLRQAAGLLAAQGANPFRVSAYRRAADAVERLDDDLRHVFSAGGRMAIDAIPGIGPSLAGAISELLATGGWSFLERLKGASDPEALFCSIPGIGPKLAHRVHAVLRIDTLEELEAAAHDGRLLTVPGFGARRVAEVRTSLAALLGRISRVSQSRGEEPDVATLLDVDREYRDKAARGVLRRIAPKRFNPSGEAWLPVLHTERGPWHFSVLYSNTARAHELGRSGDWVVVYFHRDGAPEGRRTAVTETHGPGRGCRTIRGREQECLGIDPTGHSG